MFTPVVEARASLHECPGDRARSAREREEQTVQAGFDPARVVAALPALIVHQGRVQRCEQCFGEELRVGAGIQCPDQTREV